MTSSAPAAGAPADRGYGAGARAGLPFAVATVLLGVSFGVLARQLGWGVAAPIVCSILVLSGSAQFAIASILGAGGGVGTATLAAVFVNARFLPMGLAVAPSLTGGRLRRALEGQAVVDASWALANRGDGSFERRFMIGATLPQLAAWIGGTVVGAVAGGLLGDPEALGLDVVFPAFFLVLHEHTAGRGRDARNPSVGSAEPAVGPELSERVEQVRAALPDADRAWFQQELD
jgi:4-azaleucine resistance transporter AzlC